MRHTNSSNKLLFIYLRSTKLYSQIHSIIFCYARDRSPEIKTKAKLNFFSGQHSTQDKQLHLKRHKLLEKSIHPGRTRYCPSKANKFDSGWWKKGFLGLLYPYSRAWPNILPTQSRVEPSQATMDQTNQLMTSIGGHVQE